VTEVGKDWRCRIEHSPDVTLGVDILHGMGQVLYGLEIVKYTPCKMKVLFLVIGYTYFGSCSLHLLYCLVECGFEYGLYYTASFVPVIIACLNQVNL
jgi:hypothetical protein